MDDKEKARAYDEALERAKKLQEKSNGMILDKWLIGVFPELAESEDEKIRKELIDYHRSMAAASDDYVHEAWISWLEKQKEKQSIWTDNDRVMAFTLLRDVDKMTYISTEGKNERIQWLNSLEDKFNNVE